MPEEKKKVQQPKEKSRTVAHSSQRRRIETMGHNRNFIDSKKELPPLQVTLKFEEMRLISKVLCLQCNLTEKNDVEFKMMWELRDRLNAQLDAYQAKLFDGK
jgi:hypothetical protein